MPQQTTNRTILDAIERVRDELSAEIDGMQRSFTAFQQSMPDAYVPRREQTETLGNMRERANNHEVRLTSIEEWRLAETKRAAEAQGILSAQIGQAVMSAIKETGKTRATLDERDSQRLWAVLMVVAMAGCSILTGVIVGVIVKAIH